MSRSSIDEPDLQCQEMSELAEQFLPLLRWSFQNKQARIKPYASVIYESTSCRVQLVWGGWDPYTGNTISIYYGRDRTTLDNSVVDLNDAVYYPWYDVETVLNFLDGISPQEAVDQLYVHGQSPTIPEQFKQSNLGKSISYQPEWLIRMHAVIWNHYGQRLFDVFDSRNADLWNEYLHFAREYKKVEESRPGSKVDSSKESDLLE